MCYSVQGNCIDRNAKHNGSGVSEGLAHTINGVDRHGVAYASHNSECSGMDPYNIDLTGTLAATLGVNCGMTTGRNGVVCAVDCRNSVLNTELSGTLQAKSNGGQSLNYQNPIIYPIQEDE